MKEWFYRVTTTKLSFEETRDLAIEGGFLVRPAFEENGSKVKDTKNVDFGHVIHAYFCADGEPKPIGSFQVVGPARHAFPDRIGKGVKDTRLHEMSEDFVDEVGEETAERYGLDPTLKKVTGWFVVHREEVQTPPFTAAPFAGKACLATLPPLSNLPRRHA